MPVDWVDQAQLRESVTLPPERRVKRNRAVTALGARAGEARRAGRVQPLRAAVSLFPAELDVERIVTVLLRNQVRFVVIGDCAALLHGLARATQDLDVVPDLEKSNRGRLATALNELGARLRVPGAEPVDFQWGADGFDQFTTITTRTDAGDLDICLRPDAPGGRTFRYGDLRPRAVTISIPPVVPVAALEDVIASKEASGRPKDLGALPELRALLDELHGRRT